MGLGSVVAIALGLFATAKILGGSSSTGGSGTPTASERFKVKRNVLGTLPALPIDSFKPGDQVNILLHDGVKNLDLPVTVKVITVGKDGMITRYSNMPGALSSNFPPDNARFDVFPSDVLLRIPAIGDGEGALKPHPLTDADVLLGPNVFAVTYGFGSITEMLAANPGVFTDTPVPPPPGGASGPGIYTTTDPIPTMRMLTPWAKGVVVNVKKEPTVVPDLLLAVTGEHSPRFGGSGEFGGKGFGQSTSVGYDYAVLSNRPVPFRSVSPPKPPVPVPFNPTKAPDPKKAHAIAIAIANARLLGAPASSLAADGTFRTLADFARYFPGAISMFRALQVFSGIDPDGKYGPQTQRAYDYFVFNSTRPDGSTGPLLTLAPRNSALPLGV